MNQRLGRPISCCHAASSAHAPDWSLLLSFPGVRVYVQRAHGRNQQLSRVAVRDFPNRKNKQKAMSGTQKQGQSQPFTFVSYDINARGVSDMARSHLMALRARNKQESQAQIAPLEPSQQYSVLPWRLEEKIGHQSKTLESESIGWGPPSPEARKPGRPVKRSKPSTSSSQVSSRRQSPKGFPEPAKTGSDKGSPTILATRIDELTGGVEEQLHLSVSVLDSMSSLENKSHSDESSEGNQVGRFERRTSNKRPLESNSVDDNGGENEQIVSVSA